MKKIIVLTVSLAILVMLVWAVFSFFSRNEDILIQPIQEPVNNLGGIESSPEDRLSRVSEAEIIEYWFDVEGNIFTISELGIIRKGTEAITSEEFQGVNYVKPSIDGSRVVIAHRESTNLNFSLFNTKTNNWELLVPQDISAFSWSPVSPATFVYLQELEKESLLASYNIDTGETTELIRFAQYDLDIDWILEDVILFKEPPSLSTQTSLWWYSIKSKTIRVIEEDSFGLYVKWFFGKTIGLKISQESLALIDQNGDSLAIFDIETAPSKCGFKPEPATIYCAISENGLELPDDHFKNKNMSANKIVSIPLPSLAISSENGPTTPVASLVFGSVFNRVVVDADNLQINNNFLYFINRFNKKLYFLRL